MKLILVRHGQTEENANRIIQGHRYGTLSKQGRQQILTAAKELADTDIDIIYTSDLERCIDTTNAITKYHKQTPVVMRTELREFTFGRFEGKSSRSKLVHIGVVTGIILPKRALGVESPRDVRNRVIPFINHLYTKHKDDTVLLVTHGGVIRIVKTVIDHKPLASSRKIDIPNCSIWHFDINGQVK